MNIGEVSILLILACTALIIFAVIDSNENNKKWEKFKVEHSCKVVGKMQRSLMTDTELGLSSNGNPVVITTTQGQDQTGYKCDDGITYWR